MAKIKERKGNIFESSCQTLVNTVNCVGVMGKGIAFEYRHRFPDMYEVYAAMCERGQLRPGLLHLWKKGEEGSPWILNFPTKRHWKDPARMEYIEAGLRKFADSFQSRGITSIAFPELGTSLGGLDWKDVRESMYRHLEPLPNLDVEIYHFDPRAQDSLFDRFRQKVHRFDIQDYKEHLDLPSQQARLVRDAVRDEQIASMLALQEVRGIGEKSLEKIYAFLRAYLESSGPRHLNTVAERQPELDLPNNENPRSLRREMLVKWPLRKLYYFSLMGNLISLMEYGILSNNEIRRQKIFAESFAEKSVQDKRRNVIVPITSGGDIPLHDLVPLYLVPRTPALFARKEKRDELFFIDISLDVLCDTGNEFAFTDGNAASLDTKFFRSLLYLDKIPWDVIQAEYWHEQHDGKRKRCAEFLVYPSVAPRYFSRLVVANGNAAKACASFLRRVPNQSLGHQIEIEVEPRYFPPVDL